MRSQLLWFSAVAASACATAHTVDAAPVATPPTPVQFKVGFPERKFKIVDVEGVLDASTIMIFERFDLDPDEKTAASELAARLRTIGFVHAVVTALPRAGSELLQLQVQAGPRQYLELGELRAGPGITPEQVESVRSMVKTFDHQPSVLITKSTTSMSVNGLVCDVHTEELENPPRLHVDLTVIRKADETAAPTH